MKVYEYENFPDILIKFSEKKEYLEDIVNGNIFMNESGYFRKLEDNYRGDKNDGKRPIDLSNMKDQFIEFKPLDGSTEGIKLPIEFIYNFTVGFQGDDKIPLFCCSQLNEKILEKESETTLKFKDSFLNEMLQFGKYFLMFLEYEFLENITDFISEKNIGAKCGPISYQDIQSTYDIDILGNKKYNQYDAFFKKDVLYKNQNEWRILLISNEEKALIGDDNSSFIANIKPLQWSHIGEISDLKKARINIEIHEE